MNVCVNEMALFGPYAAVVKEAKHSLTAMAQKEVCPRDEITDPPCTDVLLRDIHGFAQGFVSFRTLFLWCAIVAIIVRSAPNRAIAWDPLQ